MIREIIRLPKYIFPKAVFIYVVCFSGFFLKEYIQYVNINKPLNPYAYLNIIIEFSDTLASLNWKTIFGSAKEAFVFSGPLFLLADFAANCVKAYKTAKKQYSEAITENKELNQIVYDTGIISFRRNWQVEDKEENISFLRERIQYSNGIKILGATGFNTFANSESFLYKTVINFEGNMQILLLNPGITEENINKFANFKTENDWDNFKNLLDVGSMTEIQKRATDLPEMTTEEYTHEIFKSLIFLKGLKTKGRFIELKLYRGPLIWKIIITGEYMWLQHYSPGLHINDSSIYEIVKTNTDTTLYNHFDVLFSRIWHSRFTLTHPL